MTTTPLVAQQVGFFYVISNFGTTIEFALSNQDAFLYGKHFEASRRALNHY